jgi:hypothetical protein
VSDPRPIRITLLAKRLHMPVSTVRQAAYDLGAHWGMDRVTAGFTDDGMALTPAAVVAIRQHFGIGNIPQLRKRTAVAS